MARSNEYDWSCGDIGCGCLALAGSIALIIGAIAGVTLLLGEAVGTVEDAIRDQAEGVINDPGLVTAVIGIAIIVGSGVMIVAAILPNPRTEPPQRVAVVVLGIAGLAFGAILVGSVALGSFEEASLRLGPLFFGVFGIGLIFLGAWAAVSRVASVPLRVSGVITVMCGAFVLWVLATGSIAFE